MSTVELSRLPDLLQLKCHFGLWYRQNYIGSPEREIELPYAWSKVLVWACFHRDVFPWMLFPWAHLGVNDDKIETSLTFCAL